MIDLEAHLLPGLDDGAADEATALEMCRLASAAGTAEIVAAPTCDSTHDFDRDSVDTKTASLQAVVGDGLHLHAGAVLQLGYDGFPEVLADLSRYSINRRRYLMVQPTEATLARGAAKLFQAIREAGYTTIVSQPELGARSRGELRRVRSWVKRGCLISLNSGSLLGRHGPQAEEAAVELLDADLAHFVVSARRSARRGGVSLLEAYRFVEYRWGEQKAKRVFVDNPWAALWGESLTVPRPGRLHHSFSVRRLLGLRRS